MRLSFLQGVVRYPTSGPLQQFLVKTGNSVTFNASNGRTEITFAHLTTNYLLSESVTISNAWGPIPINTDVWLYWDIDLLTAARTFAFTLLAPAHGPTVPGSPQHDQHWFNTTTQTMNVYNASAGIWSIVIRVFAAKVNNSTFTPLGSTPGFPYAGSQVVLNNISNLSGRIIFDNAGRGIRRSAGTFFTTEDQFFVEGSDVNALKLEASVFAATADVPCAAFDVIQFIAFDHITNAVSYNDLQTTFIGMLMEDLATGQTGTLIAQGTVRNSAWTWPTVGAPLWVSTNGQLTDTDPHITDNITYPDPKAPIARVIAADTIFFDQNLGFVDVDIIPTVPTATTTVLGLVTMSLTPVSPPTPIAVGDNDPRMSNARVPLSHTHPSTDVLITPAGHITATSVQAAIQQLDTLKVQKAGDTMTGFLTLFADPVSPLQAATKEYVDNVIVSSSGTVTSVGLSAPAEFTITIAPITSSGTLTFVKAVQADHTIYAGPTTGGPLAPTFRVFDNSDLPLSGTTASTFNNVSVNLQGIVTSGSNVAYLSGTVAIGSGGTGQVTKGPAFDALSPLSTKGDILTFNSTTGDRLGVGTNNQILTADSSQATGLKWSNTLTGVLLKAYSEISSSPTISAGTLVLDLSTGNHFLVSLNANITTLTISNVPATGVVMATIAFTADGTLRTITWGGSVKWAAGAAPVMTSTVSKVDIVVLTSYNNGTTWFATIAGQDF